MVEFTLIFPVLAILLFGVIQFGIAFKWTMAVGVVPHRTMMTSVSELLAVNA